MVTNASNAKATKRVNPVICPKCQGRALRADPTGSSDEQPRAPTYLKGICSIPGCLKKAGICVEIIGEPIKLYCSEHWDQYQTDQSDLKILILDDQCSYRNSRGQEHDLKVQIANLEKGLIDELCTVYHDSDEATKQIVRGEFRKFRIFRGWERA